jgi:thioredoxin-like negative regulator of GroEL
MKILKFYSDTCGPCKVLDNNLKTAGVEYTAVDVNDDENAPLLEKYDIRTIPVLIKEDNGIVIGKHHGIMTVGQLKNWCNETD